MNKESGGLNQKNEVKPNLRASENPKKPEAKNKKLPMVGELWIDVTTPKIWEQAKEMARSQEKPMLLLFLGSWFNECALQDKSLYLTEAFKNGAEANYICCRIDKRFRDRPMPEKEQKIKKRLFTRYGVKNIPTLMVIKPDGGPTLFRAMGYLEQGPEELLQIIARDVKKRSRLSLGMGGSER